MISGLNNFSTTESGVKLVEAIEAPWLNESFQPIVPPPVFPGVAISINISGSELIGTNTVAENKIIENFLTDTINIDQKEEPDIKIFDIATFCSLLKEKNNDNLYIDLLDLIKIYESALGGCSCNRNARVENANHYYKAKVMNMDKNILNKIKKELNVKKIIFKDSKNEIFLQM